MKKAIGIDLGTTYSVMAIYDKHLKVIQNKETEDCTRSAVGIRNGEKLVGKYAYSHLAKGAPKDIIVSIKRIIGREFSDQHLQKWKKEKAKYQIKVPDGATEKSVAVVLGDKEYLPEEISSLILKKLKKDAEEKGYEVSKAVIAVPAYFTDKQKDATRKAAYLAGLQVLRLLPEPTASAISYKIDSLDPGESKIVLVYDLGGGTFDVSLLQITGGTFVELGIGGDLWLGGDDFDFELTQFVLKKVALKYKYQNEVELLDSINVHGKLYREIAEILLREKCREAKEELSSAQTAYIDLPAWCKDKNNKTMDIIDVKITRNDFEQLIEADIEKTINIVKDVLNESKYDIEQIDNVLLTGGSSLMPLVRRKLSAIFSDSKILLHTRPMLCVAEGAAILANRLVQTDKIECPHCGQGIIGEADRCPHCQNEVNIINPPVTIYNRSLRIETRDDPSVEIMQKGQYYPAGPFRITLYAEEDQHEILVPVNQFEHTHNEEKILGILCVIIHKDTKVSKDMPVEVSVQIDSDGIVDATARLFDSGSEIFSNYLRGGKDQEIAMYLAEAKRIIREENSKLSDLEKKQVQENCKNTLDKIVDGNIEGAKKIEEQIKEIIRGKEGNKVLQEKYVNLVNFSEYVLKQYHELLNPELTFKIQKTIENLKESIENNDCDKSEEEFLELDKLTDEIPKTVTFVDWVFRGAWLVEQEDPVLSDELKGNAQKLIDDCKNKNLDRFEELAGQIIPKVEEIYNKKGSKEQSNKVIDPNYLLKLKKSNY